MGYTPGFLMMVLGGLVGAGLTVFTRVYLRRRGIERRRTPAGRLVPAIVQLAEYQIAHRLPPTPAWFRRTRGFGLFCYAAGIVWLGVAFLLERF